LEGHMVASRLKEASNRSRSNQDGDIYGI
jgi:hypothetical protein